MSIQSEQVERRSIKRFLLEQAAVWRKRSSSQSVTARVRDISRSGIQVALHDTIDLGDDIFVSIQHPRTNAWLVDMKGSLVWQKMDGTRDTEFPVLAGIRFDETYPSKQQWDEALES